MRKDTLALSTVLAYLLAAPAHAGLILDLQYVSSGDPGDEVVVDLQITGTEGLSAISYDLLFGGTGGSATNLPVGPIPGNSASCPTVDPPGPTPAPTCSLVELVPANADGTNYNLATTGTGPTGGTYPIGYQTILAGTWDGHALIANLVALNNLGNPITDITTFSIGYEVPATAMLIGIGLGALAIGSRNAGRRRARFRLTSRSL